MKGHQATLKQMSAGLSHFRPPSHVQALQSSLVDAENRQNERWLHEYAQQDNAFEAGGEMY